MIEEPASHKKLLEDAGDTGRRLTVGEDNYSLGEIEIEDDI
jgi:hypothetical protein